MFLSTLNHLIPHKSPEANELHPRILQEWSNQLSRPHSLIFSKLFSEGELPPQYWKDANIAPMP